ncbi:XerC Integrase [uncultured Caudovirales phage]|uniref:Integrase n=1 Tax=uncultured Caudovirales phage TaxID=2100421 RepID=A0A6J5STV3_9CAUD|nr:XerC Integrase [uncultured Caudovirales phage]
MAATIKTVLLQAKENGKSTVYFQIIKNKRVKRISSGYSVTRKLFDESAGKCLKDHPNCSALNTQIRAAFNRTEGKILEIERINPDCTTDQIMDFIHSGKTGPSFFEFADKNTERFNTPDSTQFTAIKSLIKYFKDFAGADLRFNQLTTSLLRDYVAHMTKKKLAKSTQRTKLNRIQAIVNAAIFDKIIKPDENPFVGFDMPKPGKSNRQRLTLDEIKKIENFEAEPGTLLGNAKYVFLFQYYNGMRIGDTIRLKWNSIISGRLVYIMHKSTKPISFPLSKKSLDILELYKGFDPVYIFGVVKHDTLKPNKQSETEATKINKHLKIIAKKLEIDKHMHTHIARHSFTKTADDAGIELKYLQMMLGHSSEKETRTYRDSIQNDELDEKLLQVQQKMSSL